MGTGAAGAAEPCTVQQHLHTLLSDLPQLRVNPGSDGSSALGGQMLLP